MWDDVEQNIEVFVSAPDDKWRVQEDHWKVVQRIEGDFLVGPIQDGQILEHAHIGRKLPSLALESIVLPNRIIQC